MDNLPSWLLPAIAAPFVGSFLGVLAIRLPTGRNAVWGRSTCDACGHPLNVPDLVPIASWLVSRGRCRHCGAAITPLYLGIELGAVVVPLWAATVSSGWLLWASCILGWFLFALAIIDLRDGLLPDALTLPLIPLGLAAAYVDDPSLIWPRLLGAFIGFAGFASIRLLYRYIRGRDGLGLGDVKLLAAGGAFVSWDGLASVVLVSAMAALAVVLTGAAVGRSIALDQRLPFGPALCLGIWLIWLYGPLA